MGMQERKVLNTEQERQQLFDEMKAEEGSNWFDHYKPGSLGCHELLDRTALAADIVERFVLSHPACIQNRNWYALAEQAVATLREMYQQIGAEHLDGESGVGGSP